MESCIAYYRKSISVSGVSRKHAISYQETQVKNYCEENSLLLVKSFSDVGYSGKDTIRPELTEMLEFLKINEKKPSTLVIYSIDRLGRDLNNNVDIFNKIMDLIPKIHFVSDNLSSDSEHFRMLFLLMTGMAQEDREQLLTRLGDGRESKVLSRGVFNGNQYPLGMIQIGDSENKRLVPATPKYTESQSDNEGLEILKFIFVAFIFGESVRSIANKINFYYGKTRKGKCWSNKTVEYILKNPVYIGMLKGVLRGEKYCFESSNVEKLIDENIFYFIQHKLTNQARGRKPSGVKRLPDLIVCSHCLVQMLSSQDLMECPNCNRSISSNGLDEFLIDQLAEIVLDMERTHAMKHFRTDLRTNILSQIQKIKEQISVLDERRKLMENLIVNDKETLDRLISYNSAETEVLYDSLNAKEAFLNYFPSPNEEGFLIGDIEQVHPNLMSLPFITLIDCDTHEIEILFHRNIFNEVTNYESS